MFLLECYGGRESFVEFFGGGRGDGLEEMGLVLIDIDLFLLLG